jgi:hypothetical protein
MILTRTAQVFSKERFSKQIWVFIGLLKWLDWMLDKMVVIKEKYWDSIEVLSLKDGGLLPIFN